MLRRRDCDDYTRERLALVDGQLQRIRTTLRELVNFSRPASHERTRFSPADALNEALGIAKYYKGFKSRTLTVDVPAGLPTLHGVRDQLVQAFLNLILNALDATEKAGRVEVSAVADGGDVVVRVRDDGRGVSPEHASRLFTPYFTTRKDGTGLGLFVTRQLVADHGGTVTFTSEPGAGTTFEVRLPADRPAR
jgi:signal transduction histidine kinase